MFGIGGWEMLLIGVVALLVFGPKRLPELARTLGKGLAEFRRASSDLRRNLDLDLDLEKLSAPEPDNQPPAQAGSPAETETDPEPENDPEPEDNTPPESETQRDHETQAGSDPKPKPDSSRGS